MCVCGGGCACVRVLRVRVHVLLVRVRVLRVLLPMQCPRATPRRGPLAGVLIALRAPPPPLRRLTARWSEGKAGEGMKPPSCSSLGTGVAPSTRSTASSYL